MLVDFLRLVWSVGQDEQEMTKNAKGAYSRKPNKAITSKQIRKTNQRKKGFVPDAYLTYNIATHRKT